jgi:hypothetical protein
MSPHEELSSYRKIASVVLRWPSAETPFFARRIRLYCIPVRCMLRCAWKTEERNEPMPRYHFRVSCTTTHTGTLAVDAATPQVARRLAEQRLDAAWHRDPDEVPTLLENVDTLYHLDIDHTR